MEESPPRKTRTRARPSRTSSPASDYNSDESHKSRGRSKTLRLDAAISKRTRSKSRDVRGSKESAEEVRTTRSKETGNTKRRSSISRKFVVEAAEPVDMPRVVQPSDPCTRDIFCWVCHKDGGELTCATCPRNHHLRCIGLDVAPEEGMWICEECVIEVRSDQTDNRSWAMRQVTLEQLCKLLKLAVKEMELRVADPEKFMRPVSLDQYPDYLNYIFNPMDLSTLAANIDKQLYGCPAAFLADTKWILHNSMIFNDIKSEYNSTAKKLVNVCKQDMAEIENCPECYLRAHTQDDWFPQVCSVPHLLVWAKARSYPPWPAKVMKWHTRQKEVDCRFFGDHDKAVVKLEDVFLYSAVPPGSGNRAKNPQLERAIVECKEYINNIAMKYGLFKLAPPNVPYLPNVADSQMRLMIPSYRAAGEKEENITPVTSAVVDAWRQCARRTAVREDAGKKPPRSKSVTRPIKEARTPEMQARGRLQVRPITTQMLRSKSVEQRNSTESKAPLLEEPQQRKVTKEMKRLAITMVDSPLGRRRHSKVEDVKADSAKVDDVKADCVKVELSADRPSVVVSPASTDYDSDMSNIRIESVCSLSASAEDKQGADANITHKVEDTVTSVPDKPLIVKLTAEQAKKRFAPVTLKISPPVTPNIGPPVTPKVGPTVTPKIGLLVSPKNPASSIHPVLNRLIPQNQKTPAQTQFDVAYNKVKNSTAVDIVKTTSTKLGITFRKIVPKDGSDAGTKNSSVTLTKSYTASPKKVVRLNNEKEFLEMMASKSSVTIIKRPSPLPNNTVTKKLVSPVHSVNRDTTQLNGMERFGHVAAMSSPSISTDEDVVEERTPEHGYSRASIEDGPSYLSDELSDSSVGLKPMKILRRIEALSTKVSSTLPTKMTCLIASPPSVKEKPLFLELEARYDQSKAMKRKRGDSDDKQAAKVGRKTSTSGDSARTSVESSSKRSSIDASRKSVDESSMNESTRISKSEFIKSFGLHEVNGEAQAKELASATKLHDQGKPRQSLDAFPKTFCKTARDRTEESLSEEDRFSPNIFSEIPPALEADTEELQEATPQSGDENVDEISGDVPQEIVSRVSLDNEVDEIDLGQALTVEDHSTGVDKTETATGSTVVTGTATGNTVVAGTATGSTVVAGTATDKTVEKEILVNDEQNSRVTLEMSVEDSNSNVMEAKQVGKPDNLETLTAANESTEPKRSDYLQEFLEFSKNTCIDALSETEESSKSDTSNRHAMEQATPDAFHDNEDLLSAVGDIVDKILCDVIDIVGGASSAQAAAVTAATDDLNTILEASQDNGQKATEVSDIGSDASLLMSIGEDSDSDVEVEEVKSLEDPLLNESNKLFACLTSSDQHSANISVEESAFMRPDKKPGEDDGWSDSDEAQTMFEPSVQLTEGAEATKEHPVIRVKDFGRTVNLTGGMSMSVVPYQPTSPVPTKQDIRPGMKPPTIEKDGAMRDKFRSCSQPLDALELKLAEWCHSSGDASLSAAAIATRAMQLAHQMALEDMFDPSRGWLINFKARHGIKTPPKLVADSAGVSVKRKLLSEPTPTRAKARKSCSSAIPRMPQTYRPPVIVQSGTMVYNQPLARMQTQVNSVNLRPQTRPANPPLYPGPSTLKPITPVTTLRLNTPVTTLRLNTPVTTYLPSTPRPATSTPVTYASVLRPSTPTYLPSPPNLLSHQPFPPSLSNSLSFQTPGPGSVTFRPGPGAPMKHNGSPATPQDLRAFGEKAFSEFYEKFLSDASNGGHVEATNFMLRRELEQTRWHYENQLRELSHNFNLTIIERNNSFEHQIKVYREKQTRWEREKQAAIEETKKKQWCVSCHKEALLYCCWNTSFCGLHCQKLHWESHQETCQNPLQSRQRMPSKETVGTVGDGVILSGFLYDGSPISFKRDGDKYVKVPMNHTSGGGIVEPPSVASSNEGSSHDDDEVAAASSLPLDVNTILFGEMENTAQRRRGSDEVRTVASLESIANAIESVVHNNKETYTIEDSD